MLAGSPHLQSLQPSPTREVQHHIIMSSLLLILLAFAGVFCHPSQVAPVDEDCPTCPDTLPVLSPEDLTKLCSVQPTRKSCYNNLPSCCKTTAYKNKLDAVDYICQSSVKSRLSQQLSTCIQPNQAIIDKKYEKCQAAIPSGLTGSCQTSEIRKCVIKSLNDCCASACSDQDRFVYYFIKPSSVSSNCPWKYDSGYCSLATSPCVMPSK